MPKPVPLDSLDRLRRWRNVPDKDLSAKFMADYFKKEIERPYRQLKPVIEVWNQHVPATLKDYCRLEGMTRGVLRVAVNDSVRLYELHRLLREGLEQKLVAAARGAGLKRVALRVG